jgi:serine/threonine-protein phosphatase 2A activator
MHQSISGLPNDSIFELTGYFNECWGNRTRVDYGSGMELNFLCWLCVCLVSHISYLIFLRLQRLCLERLGALQQSDHKAIVLRVFWRYASHQTRVQWASIHPLAFSQIHPSDAHPPIPILA